MTCNKYYKTMLQRKIKIYKLKKYSKFWKKSWINKFIKMLYFNKGYFLY